MEDFDFKKIGRRIVIGFISFLALVSFFSSYTVITPGNTGVIFNEWTGSLYSVGQGLVFKVPFVTDVQDYPTALRTYTMVRRAGEGTSKEDDSLDLPTLEGQHIHQDLSITYNTSQDKAAAVFKSFRGDDIRNIENTFIRRTAITVAQNAAGQMSLSDIISSKRDKLQSEIQDKLSIELGKMGFTLDKINLGASHLPQAIEEQMQIKMKAQQEAQQAEYELQKQSVLAKAVVVTAQGEADAKVIAARAQAKSQELLQTTLTDKIIQLEYLKRWSGNLPTYMTGTGTQTLMMMPNFNKKGE